jgi:hypothetical protein
MMDQRLGCKRTVPLPMKSDSLHTGTRQSYSLQKAHRLGAVGQGVPQILLTLIYICTLIRNLMGILPSTSHDLLSLFANDRRQHVGRWTSIRDWSIDFSPISWFRYVDLMRIFQWNLSRFWQSLCFLFSQITAYNDLTGELPIEFGGLSDTLTSCFLSKKTGTKSIRKVTTFNWKFTTCQVIVGCHLRKEEA